MRVFLLDPQLSGNQIRININANRRAISCAITEALLVTTDSLLQPTDIKHLHLRNRVAVAPMTRTSALEDGCVSPLMVENYALYARGGYGLVFTEGTYTDDLH